MRGRGSEDFGEDYLCTYRMRDGVFVERINVFCSMCSASQSLQYFFNPLLLIPD